MKIKKLGALLVSAALCAGMAAPAFAFEGEAAPVEQPVLPEVVEEDVVTITDETSGALTPEDSLTVSRCGTKPLRHRCAMPPPGLRHPAFASLSLASCWPLPQQLLPVSAAGGGRRRCS